MTRDANAFSSEDPAVRWSALLQGLPGRRRDIVVKALRDSVDSGYPANADGVRILVAYAQGQISARQYVTQILESLGFVRTAHVPAAPARPRDSWHSARDADPWRAPARTQDPWNDELSSTMPAETGRLPQFNESRPVRSREAERFEGNTITQSRRTSRKQAVQAFVSGQIPMEEFLRLTNG